MRKFVVLISLIAVLFHSNVVLLGAENSKDWNEYKVNFNYSKMVLQEEFINHEIRGQHCGNPENDKYDVFLFINENQDSLLIINIIKKRTEKKNACLLDLEDLLNNLIILSGSCLLGANVATGIAMLTSTGDDENSKTLYLTILITSIIAPLLLTKLTLKLNQEPPLYMFEIKNEEELCFDIVINNIKSEQLIYGNKKQIRIDLKEYSSFLKYGINQIELINIKSRIKIIIEMELE